MRELKDLIKSMDKTLKEASTYIDRAFILRSEHKSLADTYAKIGEMHLTTIYDALHKEAVGLIEESKRSGVQPPASMVEIWAWQHETLISEHLAIKIKLEEYKKMGY